MSELSNIPKLPIGAVVDMLSKLYIAVIKKGNELSRIPAPFLWGPPGVGKSDGVRQMAEIIAKETGKRLVVTDIRLLMFSPVDLRGVPVADEKKEFTNWLKPKILDLDPSGDVLNILFLDELSAAPASMQAVGYQITLDRTLGEHRLPDNCIVIAAGNGLGDMSVVHRMSHALANRLMHFSVTVDFAGWKEWAITHKVHPYVLGYLSFDHSKLCQENVGIEELAYATPRTWTFVSNILNMFDEITDVSYLFSQISACIGSGNALEFITWCKNHEKLPSLDDIFKGKSGAKYPKTPDALYALINAVVSSAKTRKSLTISELENVVRYASKFPLDYQTCLYTRLCDDEDIKLKLLKITSFREWMKKNL